MPKRGDFSVSEFAANFAENKHEARTERSQKVDEAERAPVTTDAGEWAQNPDELDYPGVDTPQQNPNVLPKDLKNPAPTAVADRARNRPRREMPSPDRNTTAPESETARLSKTDVSLAPEEAFEGVGSGSQEPSNKVDLQRQFAGGEMGDVLFVRSEQNRR